MEVNFSSFVEEMQKIAKMRLAKTAKKDDWKKPAAVGAGAGMVGGGGTYIAGTEKMRGAKIQLPLLEESFEKHKKLSDDFVNKLRGQGALKSRASQKTLGVLRDSYSLQSNKIKGLKKVIQQGTRIKKYALPVGLGLGALGAGTTYLATRKK